MNRCTDWAEFMGPFPKTRSIENPYKWTISLLSLPHQATILHLAGQSYTHFNFLTKYLSHLKYSQFYNPILGTFSLFLERYLYLSSITWNEWRASFQNLQKLMIHTERCKDGRLERSMDGGMEKQTDPIWQDNPCYRQRSNTFLTIFSVTSVILREDWFLIWNGLTCELKLIWCLTKSFHNLCSV